MWTTRRPAHNASPDMLSGAVLTPPRTRPGKVVMTCRVLCAVCVCVGRAEKKIYVGGNHPSSPPFFSFSKLLTFYMEIFFLFHILGVGVEEQPRAQGRDRRRRKQVCVCVLRMRVRGGGCWRLPFWRRQVGTQGQGEGRKEATGTFFSFLSFILRGTGRWLVLFFEKRAKHVKKCLKQRLWK